MNTKKAPQGKGINSYSQKVYENVQTPHLYIAITTQERRTNAIHRTR